MTAASICPVSLNSWWENKPPSQRVLVRIGAVTTVTLLVGALLLDALTDEHFVFPSLTGFVWDLTKLALLGTAGVAIVDDLRGWGAAWRTLVVTEPALCSATDHFVRATWVYLGLDPGRLMSSRSLAGAAQSVELCGAVQRSLLMNNSRIHDAQLVAMDPDTWKTGHRVNLPSVESLTVATWDDLERLLAGAGIPSSTLKRQSPTSPEDLGPVQHSIDQLQQLLAEAVSDPASSTELRTQVGRTRAEFLGLPGELRLMRAWLIALASGSAPETGSLMAPGANTMAFVYLAGFLTRAHAEIASGSPTGARYSAA